MDNASMAERFKEILMLRYEPVAVKLLGIDEAKPEGFTEPEENMSHCQTIMNARMGERYYLSSKKHGCPVGASSLGLMVTPDKVRDGRFHHKIGMFDSDDSAKAMIDARLENPVRCSATLVSPLKDADFEPDVVIIADYPERLFWFIPAETYDKGGRVNFSTAAFQATCVDATLIPLIEGHINFSFGCYGCRKRTNIQKDEAIVGIPGKDLERLLNNLEAIAEKPMTKAKRD